VGSRAGPHASGRDLRRCDTDSTSSASEGLLAEIFARPDEIACGIAPWAHPSGCTSLSGRRGHSGQRASRWHELCGRLLLLVRPVWPRQPILRQCPPKAKKPVTAQALCQRLPLSSVTMTCGTERPGKAARGRGSEHTQRTEQSRRGFQARSQVGPKSGTYVAARAPGYHGHLPASRVEQRRSPTAGCSRAAMIARRASSPRPFSQSTALLLTLRSPA
jgi:hypothetical protein